MYDNIRTDGESVMGIIFIIKLLYQFKEERDRINDIF